MRCEAQPCSGHHADSLYGNHLPVADSCQNIFTSLETLSYLGVFNGGFNKMSACSSPGSSNMLRNRSRTRLGRNSAGCHDYESKRTIRVASARKVSAPRNVIADQPARSPCNSILLLNFQDDWDRFYLGTCELGSGEASPAFPLTMSTRHRLSKDIIGRCKLSTAAAQQESTPEAGPPADTKSVDSSRVSAVSTRRKRPFQENDNGDNDDDEKDSKRSRNTTLIVPDSEEKDSTYACPFRKHNPKKYSVSTWKTCALTSLATVARLKSHLYRYHLIYPCQRCGEVFDSQDVLIDHLKAAVICTVGPPKPVDGISPELMQQLRSRKKAFKGQTEAERWQQIYQMIFPGEQVPDPYFVPVFDKVAEVSPQKAEVLDDYQNYLRQDVPRLVRLALDNQIGGTMEPFADKLKGQIVDMVRQAMNQASGNYKAKSIRQSVKEGTGSNDSEYEPSLARVYQAPGIQRANLISQSVGRGTDSNDSGYEPSLAPTYPYSLPSIPEQSSFSGPLREEQWQLLLGAGGASHEAYSDSGYGSREHFDRPSVVSTTKLMYQGSAFSKPPQISSRNAGRSSTDLAITSLISSEPKGKGVIGADNPVKSAVATVDSSYTTSEQSARIPEK